MGHRLSAMCLAAALAAFAQAQGAQAADWIPGPESPSDGVLKSGELRTGRQLPAAPSPDTALFPAREGGVAVKAKNGGVSAGPGWTNPLRLGPSEEEARGRLRRLDGVSQIKTEKEKAKNIRVRAIGEAGVAIAFQQGLRWRYAQLENACRLRANELDRIFDFRQLLLDGRVLPPVIQWAGRSVTVHGGDAATAVDATYRIVKPARIVSTAPIWEAYLIKDFEAFDGTVEVLPKTSQEKTAWREGVDKGWAEGVAHADEVFDMNMNSLVSDFRGMLRFKMLARAGMVSVPVLAEGRLGVKVGDRTLDVNETVFRITAPAGFKGRAQWKPGTTGVPE